MIDSSARLVDTLTIKQLGLKAGRSKPATVTVLSLPATLADGTHSFLAQVTDPSNIVTTTAAGNPITVAALYVSLSLSLATVRSAALVPGKGTPLVLTLTNAGNIDAVGLATIVLSIDADGITTAVGKPQTKHLKVKAGKPLIVHVTLKTAKTQTDTMLILVATVTFAGETVTSQVLIER